MPKGRKKTPARPTIITGDDLYSKEQLNKTKVFDTYMEDLLKKLTDEEASFMKFTLCKFCEEKEGAMTQCDQLRRTGIYKDKVLGWRFPEWIGSCMSLRRVILQHSLSHATSEERTEILATFQDLLHPKAPSSSDDEEPQESE